MANKRKPHHLKVIQGTARKDRAKPLAPKAVEAAPTAPAALGPRERAHFEVVVERLGELGLASETFVGTVSLLAQALVEAEDAGKEIKEHGLVLWPEDETQMPRRNPAVDMRSDARRRAHALYRELGLTPTSIENAIDLKKLKSGPGGGNPFAELESG